MEWKRGGKREEATRCGCGSLNKITCTPHFRVDFHAATRQLCVNFSLERIVYSLRSFYLLHHFIGPLPVHPYHRLHNAFKPRLSNDVHNSRPHPSNPRGSLMSRQAASSSPYEYFSSLQHCSNPSDVWKISLTLAHIG